MLSTSSTFSTNETDSFALSQSLRCTMKKHLQFVNGTQRLRKRRISKWKDCDKTKDPSDELAVMGYSMRTSQWRYSGWFPYDRPRCVPLLDRPPLFQELYDHQHETLADFTHRETVNVADLPESQTTVDRLREALVHFVKNKVIFRGCFK